MMMMRMMVMMVMRMTMIILMMVMVPLLLQANHRILTYMKYSYLWTESRNDTM